MEKLITVIVPVYNTEKYLTKCVDSIINQTYRNLEIILVDDGSLDRCPEICDEYAKKDSRIKVIHQKNGGLSVARNSGLDMAKGDLISFVDSDDFINVQMYEKLYKNLKDYDADISVCNYNFVYEDNDFKINDINNIKECITIRNKMEALGNLDMTTIVAWNKLYKKELFNNIRYPSAKLHEDEFIIHRILDKAKTVVFSNHPLYNYLQSDNSITRGHFNLKRLDVFEALEDRMVFFHQNGYRDLYFTVIESYLNVLITYYYYSKKDLKNDLYISFRKDFKEIYLEKRNELKGKIKIKCDVFYLSPGFYRILLKAYKLFLHNRIV